MTPAVALALSLALLQHAHTSGMDARGNIAMGFDQARATHEFVATPDGGEIRIVAKQAADEKTIGEIRAHVREIETRFASGDFAKPEFIHGEMPPGAKEMASKTSDIAYRYTETSSGATLLICSNSPAAIQAVHAYLRYQKKEHGG